jgi:DNA gyrase subunit A
MVIRTPVKDILVIGRNSQGVKIVNLKNDNQVTNIEIIKSLKDNSIDVQENEEEN